MNLRNAVKSIIPKKVFRQIEPYGHWVEAVIAQNKYGFPAKGLNVIGVTGTDGKTTTCQLITSVLKAGAKRTACITTASVDYGDGKGEQPNPTGGLTTGNAFELAKLIRQIKDNGVEFLVLEVSSHALQQRRVWGIPFTVGVMTNMSPEHLDYHGTFEKYRKAKELLFEQVAHNKNGLGVGIINADDKTAHHFKKHVASTLLYGIKKGDIKAEKVSSTFKGNSFVVKEKRGKFNVTSKLLGDFNVYNALAAVAVGRAVGIAQKDIQKGIANVQSVKGRMMPIDEGQPFHVLIDYAVTPGALEHVLSTVRNIQKKGKIHIVFGATGDRDKTKRPKMGKVTAQLADYVYLTDDETYTEDPATIRQAVYAGVPQKLRKKVSEHDDRRDAIAAALKAAKKDDVVIIAGFGHQTTRNTGGKKREVE